MFRKLLAGPALVVGLLLCAAHGMPGEQGDEKEIAKAGPYTVQEHLIPGPDGQPQKIHRLLITGNINFGTNLLPPDNPKDRGNPTKDFSRLATTYYHRQGPAGVVLERFNWFPDPRGNNTYWADARMPASLVGLGLHGFGQSLPAGQLVGAWSEPAVGVIRINAGTLGAYARPFQVFDFYDDDGKTMAFSLPAKDQPFLFRYISDAKGRGAHLRFLIGNERESLAKKAPKRFYHALFVEVTRTDLKTTNKDLLTKEAVASYLETLAEHGVLCFHTSHRYLKFAPVIADAAKELGLVCVVAHDQAPGFQLKDPEHREHWTSEWVLVARKQAYLDRVRMPAQYQELLQKTAQQMPDRVNPNEPFFSALSGSGKYLWTDGGRNSTEGLEHDPAK